MPVDQQTTRSHAEILIKNFAADCPYTLVQCQISYDVVEPLRGDEPSRRIDKNDKFRIERSQKFIEPRMFGKPSNFFVVRCVVANANEMEVDTVDDVTAYSC